MYPKELINNEYAKPFQKVRLNFDNWLILYYYTPIKASVTQIRLRVVPINFRLVLMSAYHIYPLT